MFYHQDRDIALAVHGDDFTACGRKCELDKFESMVRSHYELTVGGRLGPGPQDDKEATVLNRVIRRTDRGVEYEADPRHGDLLILSLGLEQGASVKTPGVKPSDAEFHTEFEFFILLWTYFHERRPWNVIKHIRR